VKEPVESLVQRLAVRGPETDMETVRSIVARKEEALPHLVRVATEEKYWDTESGLFSVWAPICAMHILSKIGGNKAASAVYSAMRTHYDDTGDWITEDMPYVLAAFGPGGFDTLASMVADTSLDEYVRDGAARALIMISQEHPEIKSRSVEVLKKAITDESDESARSILTDTLAEFKDKDTLPFIEDLFKKGLIDTGFIDYDTVLDVYAGKFDHLQRFVPRDPLDIFIPRQDNFYRKNNPLPKSVERHAGKTKVGRNDPCPCGSGRKFKKCCLKVA
jgi:hypothetical protein